MNYNNFVAVLSFLSLAIFCLVTEYFSNFWYVYFWIWPLFLFSMKWQRFLRSYCRFMKMICRFRVTIFYQLFESIQNHVAFYRCWHFYSNFAWYFQTSLNQRWTKKIRRCECCSYLCSSILYKLGNLRYFSR